MGNNVITGDYFLLYVFFFTGSCIIFILEKATNEREREKEKKKRKRKRKKENKEEEGRTGKY